MSHADCPVCPGTGIDWCERCRNQGEVCGYCLNDPDKTDCDCREPRDGAFPCTGGDYGPDVIDGYRRMK